MQSNLYVTLSAQLSLQRRLDTISHNIANATTAGFRAEQVTFETIMSETSADPVAFVTAGNSYLSRTAGSMVKTDNSLDIAIQGDAWFGISSAGGQAYTRDGRMKMTDTGELQTLNGQSVLDAGGAPIVVDPSAGPITIAKDGMISQGNRQFGAVGLFTIDPRSELKRFENSGVIPSLPATPVADPSTVGVVQGFVERSNVNPVIEISRLIAVTRAFEAISNGMTDSEQSLDDAIQTLGG